jgi:cytidylate kinase
MDKKHIITIAGKPGSGKSTTAKGLSQTLNYERFSSGDFFRAIGKERGIDVFATNLMAESEKDIDELVDQKLRDLGESGNNLIIDSRMAWHWMPYSFRVYLDLDITTAAERIFTTLEQERLEAEHIPDTAQEYAAQLQQRLDSEAKRYQNLYQVNPYDITNYDFVINTAQHSTQKVQSLILEAYNNWLQ